MLADVEWPALVAAAGGVLVALVTVVATALTGRDQRGHERQPARDRQRHELDLARRERLYADVRTAYNLALAAMERVYRRIWLVASRYEAALVDEMRAFGSRVRAELREYEQALEGSGSAASDDRLDA